MVTPFDQRVDVGFAVASALLELTREPGKDGAPLFAARGKGFEAPLAVM